MKTVNPPCETSRTKITLHKKLNREGYYVGYVKVYEYDPFQKKHVSLYTESARVPRLKPVDALYDAETVASTIAMINGFYKPQIVVHNSVTQFILENR